VLMQHLMAAGFKGGVILISGLQVDILSGALSVPSMWHTS